MAKINARLQHKTGKENEWKLAEEKFQPLKGEFIIYLPDDNYSYSRLKIGTGNDYLKDLPFLTYSAYDIAKANDPINTPDTETEWLASLVGRGIRSAVQTTEATGSNESNIYTVTLTDGESSDFIVKNGGQGEIGPQGIGIASIQATERDDGTGTDIKINLTDVAIEPEEFFIRNGEISETQLNTVVESIAEDIQRKCQTYTFDTKAELDNWLSILTSEQLDALNTGDVFLIRDVGVPDYWWDEDTSEAWPLETSKIDLSGYCGLDTPNITTGELAGIQNLSNYKIRVAADGDTGLEGYITFII